MRCAMIDPETRERSQERREVDPCSRPFDNSDLSKIPHATSDDPPYRNWWVVDDSQDL